MMPPCPEGKPPASTAKPRLPVSISHQSPAQGPRERRTARKTGRRILFFSIWKGTHLPAKSPEPVYQATRTALPLSTLPAPKSFFLWKNSSSALAWLFRAPAPVAPWAWAWHVPVSPWGLNNGVAAPKCRRTCKRAESGGRCFAIIKARKRDENAHGAKQEPRAQPLRPQQRLRSRQPFFSQKKRR